MVHANLPSLGWVVGGSGALVQALLEAVGPEGTLLVYAGWEDNPFHLAEWPNDWQEAYRQELPAFDPATSEARQNYGRFPERLRTWPGACRSSHPEANFVALGARAGWLVADQDHTAPYGVNGPLGKLVSCAGQVLLLGAPLNTMTLIHYAETVVDLPGKRRIRYEMPIRRGPQVVWEQYEDIDTSDGAFRYADIVSKETAQADFIAAALANAGIGRIGRVGHAMSHLLPAAELSRFTLAWFERRFGRPTNPGSVT